MPLHPPISPVCSAPFMLAAVGPLQSNHLEPHVRDDRDPSYMHGSKLAGGCESAAPRFYEGLQD